LRAVERYESVGDRGLQQISPVATVADDQIAGYARGHGRE
jgi:hypothetical protein